MTKEEMEARLPAEKQRLIGERVLVTCMQATKCNHFKPVPGTVRYVGVGNWGSTYAPDWSYTYRVEVDVEPEVLARLYPVTNGQIYVWGSKNIELDNAYKLGDPQI